MIRVVQMAPGTHFRNARMAAGTRIFRPQGFLAATLVVRRAPGGELPRYQAGSVVPVRIAVYSHLVDPPALFVPSGGVTLTATGPTGTVVVNGAAMSTAETGIYTYTHQSATTDALGDYVVAFLVVDTTRTTYEPQTVGFVLVGA